MFNLFDRWDAFQALPFPDGELRGEHRNDLVLLDLTIAACISAVLTENDDGPVSIEPNRRQVLIDSVAALDEIGPKLKGNARTYFELLIALTRDLLAANASPTG